MIADDKVEEPTTDKAVFENGDNGRNRRDTTTSSTSEEWKTKAANDLLVDLLDPVRTLSFVSALQISRYFYKVELFSVFEMWAFIIHIKR